MYALLLLSGEELSRFEISERLHLGDPAPDLFHGLNGGRDLVLGHRRLPILMAKKVQELQFGPLQFRLLDQHRFSRLVLRGHEAGDLFCR